MSLQSSSQGVASTTSPPFGLFTLLSPFFVSLSLLGLATYYFGNDASEGYYQLALLTGALVAIGITYNKGVAWKQIWKHLMADIKPIIPTLLFLLLVGATGVSWVIGGVIPTAVYYGVASLTPASFLVVVALLSAAMGLACGSSWLTIGTMGVAFLNIGRVMGLPEPLVAGAIISGAYCGDKLTPLSETTILASAMTNTSLLCHVRYMLWTSIPTFLLTLLIFALLGNQYTTEGEAYRAKAVDFMGTLSATFKVDLAYLLLPLFVIGLTLLAFPPLVILGLGAIVGACFTLYHQQPLLDILAEGKIDSLWERISFLLNKMLWGISLPEGAIPAELKGIFQSCGGIWGMWPTITIVFASVVLSGVLEATGILRGLLDRITRSAPKRALVTMTVLTAIFFNITMADQYLAIILASKLFKELFQGAGLASENLSRSVEDAATVTSPLVPWNTCGSAQAKVLKVPTLDYLPFCFFNWLSPLVTILLNFFNIRISRIAKKRDP